MDAKGELDLGEYQQHLADLDNTINFLSHALTPTIVLWAPVLTASMLVPAPDKFNSDASLSAMLPLFHQPQGEVRHIVNSTLLESAHNSRNCFSGFLIHTLEGKGVGEQPSTLK